MGRAHRWSRIERELRGTYGELIAGVDEVGRGPLAGPVVACAIIMPSHRRPIPGVDDSKRLTPQVRQRLAVRIRAEAVALQLAAASVHEIDALNIYHATTLAMRRALARLRVQPHHVVLDGRPIRALGVPHTAVVMGDSRCYSVACASILAKVTRDHLMDRLARRYPRYGWERNAGYATEEHVVALDYVGGTPHHRTTFRIRQLTLGLDEGDADAQAMPSGFLGDDDLEVTLAELEGLESAPGADSDIQASL